MGSRPVADDSDVSIVIGTDASAVAPGAEAAAASIEGIAASMEGVAAAMAAQTVAINAGFAAMIAQSKKTAEELESDSIRETLALKGVGAAAIQTVTQLKEMKEAAFGLGELFLAAFAVHEIQEFASHMAESAEQVAHTASTFGLTTAEVQKLKAEAAGVGVSFDAVTGAMQRSDKAMTMARQGGTQQAAVFKQLGIDIHGSYDSAQLFQAEMAGLGNIADPVTKVGLAMQIFGKNIREVAPLLNLNTEEQKALNDEIARTGAISDDAEAKGLALAEAYNENHVAMLGLENVMASVFAPIITQVVNGMSNLIETFVQSYNSGGLVKTIMDAIAISVKATETAFVVLGAATKMAFELVFAIETQLLDAFAPIGAAVMKLAQIIGTELANAFGPATSAAISFFQGIWNWLVKVAEGFAHWLEGLPVIGGAFKNMEKDASASLKQIQADAANTAKAVGAIWGPDAKANLPKGAQGTPGGGVTAKPTKEKKDPSQMSKLEDGLDNQENADSDNGKVFIDKYQEAVDYWAKIKAGGGLSAEDTLAVDKKLVEAEVALNQQRAQGALESIKQETAAQLAAVATQLANTKAGLESQIKAVEDAEAKKQISYTAGQAKITALVDQLTAAEDKAAEQRYAITKAGLDKEMALYSPATNEYKKMLAEESAAKQAMVAEGWKVVAEGVAKEQAAEQKAYDARLAQATKFYTQVGDFARTTTEGLIEGTETWSQVFTKLWEGALNMVLEAIEKQVVAYMAGETAKTTASQVGMADRLLIQAEGLLQGMAKEALSILTSITNYAAQAAAGAFASQAAIPVIGPELGMAASVAVEADVLGLAGLVASAAGGWGDVPYDGAPAILHKQEMVLPASIANPLRASLAAGGGVGADAAGSGDTHIHIHAVDSQSVQRLLTQQRGTISAGLRREVREGRLG